MKVTHLLCAIATPAVLLWSFLSLPSLAPPEIASGDGIVNADIVACLSRTDTFIGTLDVEVEKGQIDRTGYFGDGSFRILCYPNPYGRSNQSLVIIFAAHDTDFDIANTFVQIAINQIAD
ncbi:MAG: hypothetical protein DCF25_21615 [Leptolyngbya foveolarum]|uniref:Uncharacterized protein n=1 Tax=Leptolyngbya foveolarum TaxID=47253 RepID=A0A2W4TKP9_9CYAN|nr:MAG: hypothetical protein DCF25_21615 [Leptolyngbya foveolarum]